MSLPAAFSTTMRQASGTTEPRFASVLVARSNQERPTELEVHLRPHCEKMRVHAKLSGAHMIFPKESSSSLALRIYYAVDLDPPKTTTKVHKKDAKKTKTTSASQSGTVQEETISEKEEDDWDGMLAFLRHFQFTLVIFVLPDFHQHPRVDSHQTTSASAAAAISNSDNHGFLTWVQQHQDASCPSRILVVSNTQQATDALFTVTDALGPVKRKLRYTFCQRQQQQHALLATNTASTNKTQEKNGESIVVENEEMAMRHVATAVRTWGDRLGLLTGEADLLLACCHGRLAMVALKASQGLPGIPVDPSTRQTLQGLFGNDHNQSGAETLQPQQHHMADTMSFQYDQNAATWETGLPSNSFPPLLGETPSHGGGGMPDYYHQGRAPAIPHGASYDPSTGASWGPVHPHHSVHSPYSQAQQQPYPQAQQQQQQHSQQAYPYPPSGGMRFGSPLAATPPWPGSMQQQQQQQRQTLIHR